MDRLFPERYRLPSAEFDEVAEMIVTDPLGHGSGLTALGRAVYEQHVVVDPDG